MFFKGLQWQWYWTVDRREAGSNSWMWTTSDKPITSFLWATDRPSVQNLPEERCITFSYDSKGWDDGKCNDFFPPICEKNCL